MLLLEYKPCAEVFVDILFSISLNMSSNICMLPAMFALAQQLFSRVKV